MLDNRPLSLTDVMNGMNGLSLNMKLSPPLFQFFWGLIMAANSLKPRFKNPFDLTVGQAIGIGGGNSRQAVWTKQQKLKKIKIDGHWLVKIKNGNRQKNVPATYEINYELMVPLNLVIPEFQAHQSKIIDSSVDASVDRSIDRSVDHPKIREEKRRSNPPTPKTDVTKQMSSDTEKAGAGDGLLPEDSDEDWITYIVDIMSKPKDKFPPLDLIERATWLVKHNDLELLEECYDVFQKVPLADVSNRPAYFMSIIEARGGEVIR